MSKITNAELAAAFEGEPTKKAAKKTQIESKGPDKKRKIISISVLVIGLITLVVGVVFLVLNIMQANKAADGDFLVTAGNWTLENEPGVVWDFTEIGKGTLTTNNHTNDYDFKWAIKDDKLLVETDWLYDLEDEYTYNLDQGGKVLTLTTEDGAEYKFVAE
ncbi:hypothetical protein IKF89_02185 [Candidatus Saccharibacteria bacterium]|nr:hypothetical protein [Candidatus Saccharibacteria bacterium]